MSSTVNKQSYVEVDGQITSLNSLILDKEYITSVEVFKQDEAIARFGNKAKDGAIIITTNKEVNLIRFNDLLLKYNRTIPDSLRNMRVRINDVIVDKELVLVQDNSGMSITQFSDWGNLSAAPVSEKFIVLIRNSTNSFLFGTKWYKIPRNCDNEKDNSPCCSYRSDPDQVGCYDGTHLSWSEHKSIDVAIQTVEDRAMQWKDQMKKLEIDSVTCRLVGKEAKGYNISYETKNGYKGNMIIVAGYDSGVIYFG